jgi:hypothetical protein
MLTSRLECNALKESVDPAFALAGEKLPESSKSGCGGAANSFRLYPCLAQGCV